MKDIVRLQNLLHKILAFTILTPLVLMISFPAMASQEVDKKVLSKWASAVCKDLGAMSMSTIQHGVNLSALGLVQNKSILEGFGFSFGEGPYRMTATRIDTGRYKVTIQAMSRPNDNDKKLILLNTRADTLYPVSISKASTGKYMWNAAIQFDMEDQMGIRPGYEIEQEPVSFVNFRVVDPAKFSGLGFTGYENKATTQMSYKGNNTWKFNFGNGQASYQNGQWSANGDLVAAAAPQASQLPQTDQASPVVTPASVEPVSDESVSEDAQNQAQITKDTLIFVKVDGKNMTYNEAAFEWEIFQAQVNSQFYYLIKNPKIGIALIDIQNNSISDAESAQDLTDSMGMALDINDVTRLDPSGAEQMVSQSSKMINAWWDEDTLSFTLGDDAMADANTEQAASSAESETIAGEPSGKPVHEPGILFENSDFEMGDLTNWTAEGDAFDFQPTKGDNPTARGRVTQPSQHQGEFWIGTFEKYQGKAKQKLGGRQGDRPKGTLTSIPFEITGDQIAFLVGGGKHKDREMVSLLVDGEAALNATGKGNETLKPVVWDVSAYKGKEAQIIIKDAHTGGWGHINADDFRYPE